MRSTVQFKSNGSCTRPTADQLRTELTRHHGKVSKWIVLHDTETFAVHGEGGGEGLIVGLMDFLHAVRQDEVYEDCECCFPANHRL
jgi:hypothetical protein